MDMLRDRIAGALYGVAVGDALGGPLEFMSAEEIARRYGRVKTMLGGGWLGLRPGETTDDTAMTLAVAEGIMERPEAPFQAIGARFIKWAKSGPKDIGGTCGSSICRAMTAGGECPPFQVWSEASQQTAKLNGNRSGGNGALMRAIYPGLYYPLQDDAILTSLGQGRLTHWDKDSDEACQIYASVVHYLITEAKKGQPFGSVQGRFAAGLLSGTQYDLEEVAALGNAGELAPTGYVVDSFKCALYAIWAASSSFEEAVVYAANLGGDADTIAAICGGLVGAMYGFEAIPEKWIAALSRDDRERLDAAVEAAVESRTSG